MPLRVFNTLTQRKEPFRPRQPGIVTMFVCGPTVYDFIHLGHARTYVAFDIIARYLQRIGYAVQFVVNITDVDDHVFERAQAEDTSYDRVAERYARGFFQDLKALRIGSIARFPRASDFVGEAIQHVGTLLRTGFAYVAEGSVFFDLARFPVYGRLSGQTAEELQLRRLDPHPAKRNQVDFLLWRATSEPPSWPSPFGAGRPGWHIEDTAMALGCFDGAYDIHGGASDLVFPHHEALVAQGEALGGIRPFVRFWLHTGTLNVGNRKMSKALGNVVRVRDALRQYSPDLLRLLFARVHYRDSFVLHERQLRLAAEDWKLLTATSRLLRDSRVDAAARVAPPSHFRRRLTAAEQAFTEAMNDDFNTPRALQVAVNLARSALNEFQRRPAREVMVQFERTFGGMLTVFGVLEAGIPLDDQK